MADGGDQPSNRLTAASNRYFLSCLRAFQESFQLNAGIFDIDGDHWLTVYVHMKCTLCREQRQYLHSRDQRPTKISNLN